MQNLNEAYDLRLSKDNKSENGDNALKNIISKEDQLLLFSEMIVDIYLESVMANDEILESREPDNE